MYNFNSLTTFTEYLIAGNPEASPELLDQLSYSPEKSIRSRVAENAATPLGTLATLLSDFESDVKLSLVHNPALPVMFLKQLVLDENPDVRYGLAENPRIPILFLEILKHDDNPYVADRAQKTLGTLRSKERLIRAVA